ncbi:type I secretion system permease/ATPase [Sphingomonas sp. SORGH_AS_0950]|uniref:type I secretion system permease/ATPase n=1 Tax=Sphingomonas sp. SORGH_AS_0950 TaxID=3041792 RepID=UPI0027D81046|nr:type I secretion system permease/ATPase [Sphingomonas sp. SORGH_AS_0950]
MNMHSAMATCWRHFFAAAIFSALVNVLYVVPTIYMLQVYDRVVPTRGHQTLFFLTLFLLFSLATLALLDRVRTRLLVRAGVQMDAVLAPALLDATLGRPDKPVARQALREFDNLRQTLSGPGVLALFDAPWMPIYVLICFLVHPALGIVALAGGGVLALIAWRSERRNKPMLEHAQSAAANSYAGQGALLNGAEPVRALGMRRAMVLRQLASRNKMLSLQTEAGLAAGNYMTMTKFVRLALQSLALGLGALLAIDNLISGGAIFAASFLIARALAPIEQIIGNWKGLLQARNSYKQLGELLAETDTGPVKTQLPAPRGTILLDSVTVLNDTREIAIVADVSIALESGEVVAIIGPSGAGKSTLARVIAGAIRPNRGCLRVDGTDTADWDPERLALHIGYLPQDPTLFAGTIKENVARFATELPGADLEAIDEAVIRAADRAQARPLIQQLTGGFDYELKPGGRGLSAGQSQRIALARAMYGDPAILILDEPNAHLDSEGDAALVQSIDHYKRAGHTVIIVSHKLGILPVVDKLLVIRAGRVELFGPRDEVLQKIAPSRPRPVTTVPASA